jgi:3'(2'), 5'-bisphosphate nucleotidase
MFDINRILPQITEIAVAAGRLIMEIYNLPDRNIEKKIDNSPVTKADKEANLLICSELERLFPNIPIITEEGDIPPYSIRKHYDYYWLVDPLDGTKEFINRNEEFSVHIALMHENRPILGVCHLPAFNETFFAAKGCGAFRQKDGKTILLQADTFSMTQSGLAIAVTRSHFNQATADFIADFNFPRLIARGSSLKMLLIAAGEAHLHPRFGTTMEWDTAAPQIIVEEAGGSITLFDGSPMPYNKEDLRNPNYIVKAREI